ncbi:MAG TPA: Holliday junction resolvase RuvX [Acidimicrobiia bacterium]|nr:Holliday junction resolvase RuvX [Acidimicrobiia bacterium]
MGRVLALDHGTRRVGVAVSDSLRMTAQPHGTLDRDDPELLNRLREMVDDLDVDEIVVGLPVSLDGTEGPSAIAARAFAGEVGAATGHEVVLHDERFSTATAERILLEADVRRKKRKDVRDRLAAAVFLQSYLDAQEMR